MTVAVISEVRAGFQNDPELSNMTQSSYGQCMKQLLEKNDQYIYFEGNGSGRCVLSPAEVADAETKDSVKDLVAFLTPYIQAVCDEVGPGMKVVNGENISWLTTPSGNSSHDLKPDLIIIHRAMIHLKVENGNNLCGSPVSDVIEALRVVCEAKKKLGNQGFGEICTYTRMIAQQYQKTFSKGSIIRGIAFDSSKFILVESNCAAPVRATEGRLDTIGSFELLQGFFSYEDPLTASFVRLCSELEVREHYSAQSDSGSVAFLGKGRSGTAFVVEEQTSGSDIIYVLKVVFSTDNSTAKTLGEFRRLLAAQCRADSAHVVRVKIDSFKSGEFSIGSTKYYYWGYLIHDVGVPMRSVNLGPEDRQQICRSLNVLHLNGVFHGDARVPNVVNCSGIFKWIDLHHIVSVFADDAVICDVKTLFESMFMPRRIEWGDVSQQLESYAEGLDINVLLEILQIISSR